MPENTPDTIIHTRLRLFDRAGYLADYPDVAADGGCPLAHFLSFGRSEGRVCRKLPESLIASFERAHGLAENDDPFAVLAAHLALAPERYRYSAATIHPLLIGLFDPEFYANQFADVQLDDPLTHYLQVGWRRGGSPNSWFPNTAFLMSRSSFREEGLAPLHEFVLGAEDFLPRLRVLLTHDEQRALLAPLVDGAFYLESFPDIKKSEMDPLDHYLRHGSREGRAPSPWFNPAWYVETVGKAAEVSPLLHYRLIGARRGLLPSPPSTITRQALSADTAGQPPSSPAADEETPYVPWLTSRDLRVVVPHAKGRIVLSICHDVYPLSIGGIQVFLADEEREFSAQNICYLALAPVSTTTVLAPERTAREHNVVLIANGEILGQTCLAEFIFLLEEMARDATITVDVAVHSLLGHPPEALVEIWDAVRVRKTVYWLHDFSVICPSYTLLRNGVEFCGAPPISSTACSICKHGEARARQSPRIEAFLRRTEPLMVAPSESTLSIWDSVKIGRHFTSVCLPHGRLEARAEPGDSSTSDVQRPLRIAYCGHPAPHKGWLHFIHLLRSYGSDPRFEFYHLGANAVDVPNLIHVEVAVNGSSRTAMTEALCDHEIDLALVLSIWPETFCFVVYEALAAGCQVGVFRSSGNAAAICNVHPMGVVFDDLAALFRYIGTGEAHLVRSGQQRSRSDLRLTGTSARLNFMGDSDEGAAAAEGDLHV